MVVSDYDIVSEMDAHGYGDGRRCLHSRCMSGLDMDMGE